MVRRNSLIPNSLRIFFAIDDNNTLVSDSFSAVTGKTHLLSVMVYPKND